MNRVRLLLGSVMLAVILTGCSTSNTDVSDDASGTYDVITVDVNGKRVTCITWNDDREGGLSCDWANAK